MAITIGTNSGFCIASPSSDPAGTNTAIDGYAFVTKDTSPSTAVKITEIGFWSDEGVANRTFDIGLYSDNAGAPSTRLYVAANQTTVTANWQKVTVDWDIDPSTAYWLGVQMDSHIGSTNINWTTSGGSGAGYDSSQTSLTNPFNIEYTDNDAKVALYAVWEAATGTNCQINIGDSWKEIDSIKINIGDTWKDVVNVYQNIGDTWKTVY